MMRLKLLIAAAVVHIGLMVLYAAHFSEWGTQNALTKATYAWGDFTNSNNVYNFFAPLIGEQVMMIYTVSNSTGQEQVYRLRGNNKEVTNRINTFYNFLYLEEAQDIFCFDMAEWVFQQHPDASNVRIQVIKETMPSLETYQQGQRAKWVCLFFKDYKKTAYTADK